MLKADNAVLVVIDVQGKLATLMHEKEDFYSKTVQMIEGVKTLEMPILWNEQLPDKLGNTIESVAAAMEGMAPMIKESFSCYGNPEFVKRLKESGRKQALIVGMETHVCVYQTAMDLLREGYEVYVVADAVSSRTLQNREIGLKAMMAAGAKITCVEMALFEMLHVAKGEAFRKVIKIVK